jgi:plasmid maintenance system killer protein
MIVSFRDEWLRTFFVDGAARQAIRLLKALRHEEEAA